MNSVPGYLHLVDKNFSKAIKSDSHLYSFDYYGQQLMWLCFCGTIKPAILSSTQMYIDMYDGLKGDLALGRDEMVSALDRVNFALEGFRQYYGDGTPYSKAHIPDNAVKEALALTSRIQPPAEGSRSEDGSWVFKMSPMDFSKSTDFPAKVVADMPLLPTSRTLMMQKTVHALGLRCGNSLQIVLAMAYLYRGVQAAGMLKSPWPDMEFIIQRQNEHAPFCREPGTTIRSVAKQYRISLGQKLEQVSKEVRPAIPTVTACANKSAKLKPTSPFDEARRSFPSMSMTSGDHTAMLWVMFDGVRAHAASTDISDPNIARQWAGTKSLSSIQLLKVLEEAFVHNEPHLNFDYLTITTKCLSLAEEMTISDIGQQVMNVQRRRRAMQSALFYELVDEMLWQAAAAETRGTSSGDTALHKAASVLVAHIQSEGDACVQRALEVSSGHLADDKKPAHLWSIRPSTPTPTPDTELYNIQSMFGKALTLTDGTVEEQEAQILEVCKKAYTEWLGNGVAVVEASDQWKKDVTEGLRKIKAMAREAATASVDDG